MSGHLGTSTDIFKMSTRPETSRKTSRARTSSKSAGLDVSVTATMPPVTVARDVLRDVFSTPGAYSVMLSGGGQRQGRSDQRRLRCRQPSCWQAATRWSRRHRPTVRSGARESQPAIERQLEVGAEHVLVACEEQPSRTTRDQSLEGPRVCASVVRRLVTPGSDSSVVDPAVAARVHHRRARTSGKFSARDRSGPSFAASCPLDAFADAPEPRLG